MAAIDCDAINELARLYDIFGEDFVLIVSHSLTEPTSPTATIEDDEGDVFASALGETIEGAINAVVAAAVDMMNDPKQNQ